MEKLFLEIITHIDIFLFLDLMKLWVRFGLVSLFNGISTLFRLFNAKAILLEEQ